MWPIVKPGAGGYNIELGLLAILCSLRYLFRKPLILTMTKSKSSVPTAMGFGSLLFLTHSFFSDGELLGRMVVKGYPNFGVSPLVSAVGVIIAMVCGLLVGLSKNWCMNWNWYFFGVTTTLGFYFLVPVSSEMAYMSGLLSCVFVTSHWFKLTERFRFVSIGRTLFMGFMFHFVISVLQIFTVAYAFVPYGFIWRERTWLILVLSLCCLGVYTRTLKSEKESEEGLKKNEDWTPMKKDKMWIFGMVFFILLSAAVGVIIRVSKPYYLLPYHHTNALSTDDVPHIDRETIRLIKQDLDGFPVLTAGIWTIHFSLDDKMYSSHKRMSNLIKEAGLDFVGLLESDTMRIVMGNRDAVQFIGEDLNMYVDYGPSTRDHTWGCAFLSKYPILRSTHHLLPSPVGELACAIHATVLVEGREIDFLVSHNGQEEDPVDRFLQTTEIARLLNSSPNPAIFLGYVVARPKSSNYHILMKAKDTPNNDENFEWDFEASGAVHDIDPSPLLNNRWCEYIGYRGPGLTKLGFSNISYGDITDTELQVGKFGLFDPKKSHAVGRVKKAMRNYTVKDIRALGSEYFNQWVFSSYFEDPESMHVHLYTKLYWQHEQ